VRAARAALAAAAIVVAGVVLVSGGSDADPATPPALPGQPPPFLGTAVTGDGGTTAALDAYGDVVNIYAPGPAGAAQIANSSARQAAGTVPSDTGIVPRVRFGGGPALPPWRADGVRQRYLRGTNVVRTVASFGGARLTETAAARGGVLAVIARVRRGARASFAIAVEPSFACERGRRGSAVALLCRDDRPGVRDADAETIPSNGTGRSGAFAEALTTVRDVGGADRRWLARARPLGASAPRWARRMYVRSLLSLRSLTATNGAAAAGAREGWAYVWPRDAATDALALAAAGYRGEARRVTRFLAALPVDRAARFDEAGAPVSGRGPQGDEAGWIDAAIAATGTKPRLARGSSAAPTASAPAWRNLPDYQEGAPGDYLGNAVASPLVPPADGTKTAPYQRESARRPRGGVGRVPGIANDFGTARGLVRVAGDTGSGLDSAAAWAVRPFGLRALYPAAGKTLLRLTAEGTRFGITPGEGWTGGEDPWSAPTAWSAWALAGLAADRAGRSAHRAAVDRRAALALLADLRRAATPAGDLPERVDAGSGLPRSTTPLLWSHALTVLGLRELWPQTPDSGGQAALRRPSGWRGSAESGAGRRARH
jgi:hypothetical protein